MADLHNGFAVGGEVDRVELSLRVRGQGLNPAEVTALLRIEPTFAARMGDSVRRGSAMVKQPIGIWTYDLPTSTEWLLDDAITTLLARMPSEPTVWGQLSARYSVDIFCGLFLASMNRGTKLSAATMQELASRKIDMGLDIYAPPAEEPSPAF